jgi:hypothetical protein
MTRIQDIPLSQAKAPVDFLEVRANAPGVTPPGSAM